MVCLRTQEIISKHEDTMLNLIRKGMNEKYRMHYLTYMCNLKHIYSHKQSSVLVAIASGRKKLMILAKR
jgi:hypothetical protein